MLFRSNLWARTVRGIHRWTQGHWERQQWGSPGEVALEAIQEDVHGGGLASVILPVEKRGLWGWAPGGRPERITEENGQDVKALDLNDRGDAIIAYATGDVSLRRDGHWVDLPSVQARLGEIEFVRWRPNGDLWLDRKSTRLNSSHIPLSRMPSSA